jgi:hypothetical protein
MGKKLGETCEYIRFSVFIQETIDEFWGTKKAPASLSRKTTTHGPRRTIQAGKRQVVPATKSKKSSQIF